MALGMGELLILLTCALCGLVIPGGLLVLAFVTANRSWSATWNGHSLVLQNTFFSEKLYVDGQPADQHSGLAFTNTLRARIPHEGDYAVVEGRIRQGFLGLTIKGHILVDDVFVGGDPMG